MLDQYTRRQMIQVSSATLASTLALSLIPFSKPARASMTAQKEPLFKISLAQWSLHKLLFANEITTNDFAKEARDLDIDAIEYVNSFFKDKAQDESYLTGLNTRAQDHNVKQLLIMCDGEGALGDADETQRNQTVENHKKWIHAAKTLGCHSIRVNASSSGTFEEQQKLAADGLRKLTEYAATHDINVIVENHGGNSSNADWLTAVIKRVDHPRCGTLPDFGNFCLDWSRSDDPDAWYDRYKGTTQLMPYAKAVSAKSYDFNEQGDETTMDYHRLMKIVIAAGYNQWVGIEYEGSNLPPREGVKHTKALLERIRTQLS